MQDEFPHLPKENPAMTEALRALELRRGEPTEADRPPPSRFPMTKAASIAVQLNREKDAEDRGTARRRR